ncbi:hypothetical protein GDO78_020958 [Eleutherodactylus coqui]|uniref:Uncharacterized protein n=1 Tax=Eleutherodactylus coqui TaxID=57060 RepID=A0A8J6EHW9_ELECQ|nr:hypothetical protein GDO78_020958 [Eleutherodactylus coqui]
MDYISKQTINENSLVSDQEEDVIKSGCDNVVEVRWEEDGIRVYGQDITNIEIKNIMDYISKQPIEENTPVSDHRVEEVQEEDKSSEHTGLGTESKMAVCDNTSIIEEDKTEEKDVSFPSTNKLDTIGV